MVATQVNASKLKECRLEELCDEYETGWERDADRPINRVKAFLDSQSFPLEEGPIVLQALAEIDIERDWIWWRKWLARDGKVRDLECIRQVLAQNATCKSLAQEAKSLGWELLDPDRLALLELKCRIALGDAPDPDWMDHRPSSEIATKFPRQLSASMSEPSRSFQGPLCGRMEFGRQRSTEREEWGLIRGTDLHRFVLASRTVDTYSRRHFKIEVLSPDFAIVTNLSTKNGLYFAEGPPLECGLERLMAFPFSILLPGGTLAFF